MPFNYLTNHEEFEWLIGRGQKAQEESLPKGPKPRFSVVWFTAQWCGPCQRLDVERITGSLPEANWLKCDIDQNKYTPGFCGVRSIPTFLVVADEKVLGQLSGAETDRVITWVRNMFEAWKEGI
jgi:thioredoxin-like negative regulator of GroEL